jgi:hypothetical protein
MAVQYINVEGISNATNTFQIGENGVKIFQGNATPTGMNANDVWINTNDGSIKSYSGSSWDNLSFDNLRISGNTISSVSGSIEITPALGQDVTVNGTPVLTSGASSTDDLTEGSNLFFTDARARNAISLTTSNTGGLSSLSLSYNPTTGQFDFVGPTTINLGTETTGDYLSFVTQGDGITVTGTPGEGASPTVAVNNTVVRTTGAQSIAGTKTFTDTIDGDITGNAVTSDAWSTARTITLTGAVSGSTSIDGSGNATIATTAGASTTPAILSNGTAPSLNAGITDVEIRTLIDAQQAGTYNTVIGTDVDLDFTGANILGSIELTDGVVTAYSTRTLSPADIGAQPAGTYNTIIGTDVDLDFTGANVLGSIDLTDGVVTAYSNRTLTPSDIGAPQTDGTGATGTWPISITGNAATASATAQATVADRWTTARTITLTGDVLGSVSIDGSGNVSLATTFSGGGNYIHPTFDGDDINIDTTPLTGATVISDLDINITTNNEGHVTDANGTVSTRNLTPADIGAPSTTGTGATGTWPISITGNAATATTASSATTATSATTANTATTANRWTTSRTLTLAGDITGSVSFDGSSNVTLNTNLATVGYTHPTFTGDDIDIDTGVLAGATVISDLDFNITTNTEGHVVDANGTVSTRNLVPSDIGAPSTTGVGATGTWGINVTGTAASATTASQLSNARTISLTGDVTGSTSFNGTANVSIAATVANDSHTHTFDNLTSKTLGTGNYSTNGYFQAGRGSGSVAMTVNDGSGNANVTFNHIAGTPDATGSAGRIVCNVDSPTAGMLFQLANNATSGVGVATPNSFGMTTSTVTSYVDFAVQGSATVTGTMTASSYNTSSDMTKKENVEEFMSSDNEIQAYTYNFIDDKEKRIHVGYIAQDVQNSSLDFTVSTDTEGKLALDYTSIHTAKIAKLEQEVEDLKQISKNQAEQIERLFDIIDRYMDGL